MKPVSNLRNQPMDSQRLDYAVTHSLWAPYGAYASLAYVPGYGGAGLARGRAPIGPGAPVGGGGGAPGGGGGGGWGGDGKGKGGGFNKWEGSIYYINNINVAGDIQRGARLSDAIFHSNRNTGFARVERRGVWVK